MRLLLPHCVIGPREAIKQVLLRDSTIATITWDLDYMKVHS